MPNKTYHFKNEKCTGGKHSKISLTGMAAGDVNGEKLPMFVIGKTFHVVIEHSQKVGHHLNCLKSGLKKFIETLVPKRGRSS